MSTGTFTHCAINRKESRAPLFTGAGYLINNLYIHKYIFN